MYSTYIQRQGGWWTFSFDSRSTTPTDRAIDKVPEIMINIDPSTGPNFCFFSHMKRELHRAQADFFVFFSCQVWEYRWIIVKKINIKQRFCFYAILRNKRISSKTTDRWGFQRKRNACWWASYHETIRYRRNMPPFPLPWQSNPLVRKNIK